MDIERRIRQDRTDKWRRFGVKDMPLRKPLTFGCVMFGSTFAGAAWPDVTITSRDGSIAIRGELLSFEDNKYTIRSIIGDITIDANRATCAGDECPEVDPLDQVIRVAGPEFLLANLMPGLVEEYALEVGGDARTFVNAETMTKIQMTQDTDVLATFGFDPMSARDAFAALLAGNVEMILTERRITEREIDAFLAQGLGDLSSPERETIIAQDGIVPLVAPSNLVRSVSVSQLTAVLSGQVTNWQDLGGIDAPISVYMPQPSNPVAQEVQRALLDPDFLNITPTATRMNDLSEISDAIASDPNGFGIASISALRGARQVDMVAACGIPLQQDRFAIKSEDYPFSRRIYIYTADREAPSRTGKFIAHATNTSATFGLEDSGFNGLSAELAGLGRQGQQLAYALSDPSQAAELNNLRGFAAEVLDAERLSITFRFGSGSSQLDNKALADASRLAELLVREEYFGREIVLVGFTDSIGKSDVNRILSQRRARQVLDVITSAANTRIDLSKVRPIGFGAAYPVACNTTESGRELNRRVEVWLK